MTEKATAGIESESGARSTRPIEQLVLLTLAIALGLSGFVAHVFWFAAVIVMVALWGLQAATMRGPRATGGVVSAVVSAVVDEARELADDVHRQPAARAAEEESAADGEDTTSGDPTKQELYAQAQEAGVPGRSRMTKDELRKALGK